KAGIIIQKDPKLGTQSYSEGWAPSVEYTDRGEVYQVGQQVKTPTGTYDDVLVIDESNQESEGSHHLKFYAKGTGVVHIGWRGKTAAQELMDLIEIGQINEEEMAKAREEVLKLEKHGREVSQDVFAPGVLASVDSMQSAAPSATASTS